MTLKFKIKSIKIESFQTSLGCRCLRIDIMEFPNIHVRGTCMNNALKYAQVGKFFRLALAWGHIWNEKVFLQIMLEKDRLVVLKLVWEPHKSFVFLISNNISKLTNLEAIFVYIQGRRTVEWPLFRCASWERCTSLLCLVFKMN